MEAEIRERRTPIGVERGRRDGLFNIIIDGRLLEVELLAQSGQRWTLRIDGRIEDLLISLDGERSRVLRNGRSYDLVVSGLQQRLVERAGKSSTDGGGTVTARMPGKIVRVLTNVGETVEAGQGLVIIEAMKMQNEIKSPQSGTVLVCNVEEGQTVEAGFVLFVVG